MIFRAIYMQYCIILQNSKFTILNNMIISIPDIAHISDPTTPIRSSAYKHETQIALIIKSNTHNKICILVYHYV